MQPEIVGETLVNEEGLIGKNSHFTTNVYTVKKPEFLSAVSETAEDFLKAARERISLDEIYPVIMTDNLFSDSRVEPFLSFVGNTAWNILDSEGYDMSMYVLRFSEAWIQEHHKHSLMETHVHGHGAQISGFYFIEVPEKSSRVVIHDPRPGKVQINLPQKNREAATDASEMINFKPEPGLLIFAPAWLPHSFGRHADDKPMKFLHFNLYPELKLGGPHVCAAPQAEVV